MDRFTLIGFLLVGLFSLVGLWELRRNGLRYAFSNDRSEEAERSRKTLTICIMGLLGGALVILTEG
jgi:hypothetical protein